MKVKSKPEISDKTRSHALVFCNRVRDAEAATEVAREHALVLFKSALDDIHNAWEHYGQTKLLKAISDVNKILSKEYVDKDDGISLGSFTKYSAMVKKVLIYKLPSFVWAHTADYDLREARDYLNKKKSGDDWTDKDWGDAIKFIKSERERKRQEAEQEQNDENKIRDDANEESLRTLPKFSTDYSDADKHQWIKDVVEQVCNYLRSDPESSNLLEESDPYAELLRDLLQGYNAQQYFEKKARQKATAV